MIKIQSILVCVAAGLVLTACDNTSEPNQPSPPAIKELIIKFRPEVLNYSVLCYEGDLTDELRSKLMNERYAIRKVITSDRLCDALETYGGDSFERFIAANPCRDTISIGRLGDTLRVDQFNILVLSLPNISAGITLAEIAEELMWNHSYGVEFAESKAIRR